MKRVFHISIRCYYGPGDYTQHHQDMPLRDIAKWIKAYTFTHPTVERITVSVWPSDGKGVEE